MDPSDNDQSSPLKGGHSPIYSKKRKTATRSRKKESARPGGVNTLVNLFEPKNDGSKKQDDSPNKRNDRSKDGLNISSYAISKHGERTDLGVKSDITGGDKTTGGKDLGEQSGLGQSTSKHLGDQGSGEKHEGDQPLSKDQGDQGSDEKRKDNKSSGMSKIEDRRLEMREYSAEARTYHARYEELSRAHDRGHYTWCREGCLDLLTEPRIPLWTRIQTLQMLSTLLQPAGAEMYLTEADHVLGLLDPHDFRTQLLQDDNRKMKADREVWRIKKNLVGKDIEGTDEGADKGPADEYFELDRQLDEQLRLEVAEEMVPSRKPDVDMADDADKANAMPSPTSSERG